VIKQIFIVLAIFFVLLTSCNDSNPYNSGELPEGKPAFSNSTGRLIKHKDSLISMLPTMKTDTFDCTADIYWKIIQRGKASIPLLIESLTDTTMTNIYDDCKHGKLNIGEVSYFALQEIAEFPAFLVTHIQFDLIVNDCWNFYGYFFDNRNKKDYQKMVYDFYNTYNTNKYVFVKYDKKELNKCYRLYKIEGKLKWNE
jgi:hypothetical protein